MTTGVRMAPPPAADSLPPCTARLYSPRLDSWCLSGELVTLPRYDRGRCVTACGDGRDRAGMLGCPAGRLLASAEQLLERIDVAAREVRLVRGLADRLAELGVEGVTLGNGPVHDALAAGAPLMCRVEVEREQPVLHLGVEHEAPVVVPALAAAFERVGIDDAAKGLGRVHLHPCRVAETGTQCGLDIRFHGVDGGLARHEGIAAREHGAHLAVTEALQQFAQFGHLDGHAAHVDAAQQNDVSHAVTLRDPAESTIRRGFGALREFREPRSAETAAELADRAGRRRPDRTDT